MAANHFSGVVFRNNQSAFAIMLVAGKISRDFTFGINFDLNPARKIQNLIYSIFYPMFTGAILLYEIFRHLFNALCHKLYLFRICRHCVRSQIYFAGLCSLVRYGNFAIRSLNLFMPFNSHDAAYQKRVSSLGQPCANEIALLIAEKLGYKITIPDVKDNVCLVNGRDSMGRAGMLKITTSPQGKIQQAIIKD